MSPTRSRPAVHFTARQGFTNDPHGIVHVDGKYHMFFQYNPADVRWSEHCHWGHATSADLLTWDELDIALKPEDGEIGCWSGSVALDTSGPTILYTRIAHDDWGRGAVALARPTSGMLDWRRDAAGNVIDGPPDDRPYVAFRDPQVRRDGSHWRAVLGAGIVGVGGCALQYSSTDLRSWTLDGVLAERRHDHTDPVWTGKVWECPQLLQIDGRWVLLVSVWDDDVLHNVVYAVGDLVGPRFQPSTWGTFSHGHQLYATTTFADGDGRPCAMSWMRERNNTAPEGSPWCSAMSLPHRLRLEGERLVVGQHPNLDSVLPAIRAEAKSATQTVDTVGQTWRLAVNLPGSGELTLAVTDDSGQPAWSLQVDRGADRLTLLAPSGTELLSMPIGTSQPATLDVVVDDDICEITSTAGEGIGACRVPAAANARIRLISTTDRPARTCR